MLQCFGAARELDLLNVFQPAFTTQRVAKEQSRTVPPQSQSQFAKAIADKWLILHMPAKPADIVAVCEKNPKLSAADAELLLLAESSRDDLFTDERELHGVAAARGLTAYNVSETIILLEEMGLVDAARKKRLVFAIHAEDGRTFTPPELDALRLKGLL